MNIKTFNTLILPELSTVPFKILEESWKVSYYKEFEKIIIGKDIESGEDGFWLRELKVKLETWIKAKKQGHDLSDFRIQISLSGMPLLMAIFFERKEVSFYTARLGRELFLIEQIEQNRNCLEDLTKSSEYKIFKNYTNDIAMLSLEDFPTEYELVTYENELPNLLNVKKYEELEASVQSLVDKLIVYLNQYEASWFEKLSDFGLNLTAQYALLRIHLLKFLAILPSLDHDDTGSEVKRILLEALRRVLSDSSLAKKLKKKGQERGLPDYLVCVLHLIHLISKICPAGPLASIVRFKVRFMAKRFIAGESIDKVEKSFFTLFSTGRDVTLDQLGELVVSEKEADNYKNEVLSLIKGFGQHISKGEKNKAGINRAHVSIKVSALCSDFKPHAQKETYCYVAPRLKEILLCAKEHEVFLNIDAEHYDYRDIVFYIYQRVLLETPELHDFQQTGIVLQSYLRDAYPHLIEIVELAKKRKLCMPIRIVKGAYWDAETVEADAHSFNAPEFLNKEETDLHFRQLIIKTFDFHPHVQLCLASHNYADHSFAEVIKEKEYPDLPAIEHQCLHMTYEALSVGLAKMGWPVRNYVPVGSLLVGMAYLVRRIMENSSQVGVLTMMRSHKKKARMLSPMEVHFEKKRKGIIFRDLTQANLTSDFFNITPARTYLLKDRQAMIEALDKFQKEGLCQKFQNSFSLNGDKQQIQCSSDPSLIVGETQFANSEDAQRALDISEKAYNNGEWAQAHWLKRSSVLLKASDLMLARRNELSALIVYEAGKSVAEAYADVDEAVDFLSYYAREERKIHVHGSSQGSRGPIAAITPWNFPLAIPTGMVSAPLVAGNTVILKSAEQTPLIAQKMIEILHVAGVPKDVLIHLPGLGEIVGESLISSDKLAGVVFTGSRSVGTMIGRRMSRRVYHNQLYEKKFLAKAITEMGGKNAIIVTANAELDETVAGILYSAFGHAGQKCSAASRVLVDESVKARLIERLTEACQDIEVSKAYDFSCAINPVISKEDKERLQTQVKEAVEEARKYGGQVIVDRSAEKDLPGFCVGPSIIELPIDRALKRESYAQRELFGPVVHIMSFKDLNQAIDVFNNTPYALTGGVFSQSQDDIDWLVAKMECGNIYVNRTITGARVAIEPFGGFKFSGTGPKAGGKAYIPSFHLNLEGHSSSNEIQEVALDEGSDYLFDLARPSGLSHRGRINRVSKGLDITLHHFESLFGGIRGLDKKVLTKFHKWSNKNLESFIENEHYNRSIPGQLSYKDFSLGGEHALVVAAFERPEMANILSVLSALAMGTGVSVAARNEAAYHWWCRFQGFFRQAGIGKENFDVYFSSEKVLKNVLTSSKLSYIIIDGPLSLVRDIGEELFVEGSFHREDEERMKQIFSAFDSPNLTDFKRFCLQFIWVRSFAINTMRHGAPLDLGLSLKFK